MLEQAFNAGKHPVERGKRKVVPGSRPILDKLRRTGLAELYEDAGFEIGIPGCSYCVGMSADVAGEGEVWLSSQNRNFKNRMGKGKHFTHFVHTFPVTNSVRVDWPHYIGGGSCSLIFRHGGFEPKKNILKEWILSG